MDVTGRVGWRELEQRPSGHRTRAAAPLKFEDPIGGLRRRRLERVPLAVLNRASRQKGRDDRSSGPLHVAARRTVFCCVASPAGAQSVVVVRAVRLPVPVVSFPRSPCSCRPTGRATSPRPVRRDAVLEQSSRSGELRPRCGTWAAVAFPARRCTSRCAPRARRRRCGGRGRARSPVVLQARLAENHRKSFIAGTDLDRIGREHAPRHDRAVHARAQLERDTLWPAVGERVTPRTSRRRRARAAG